MSMRITIDLCDLASIYVQASGGYSPDVMRDLTARACEATQAAVALRLAHGVAVLEAGGDEATE